MKFTLENIESNAGSDIVEVQISPEERDILMGWIETSLRIEQNTQTGHTLTGVLEFQMNAVKPERLNAVHSMLESGNAPLHL